MPLPDLIEIVPLEKPVHAEITVPGSKSITNRALILAALGTGQSRLEGALWSGDTQVMVEALQKLGFQAQVEPDPQEFCNRTITVTGLGGKIPNAGTAQEPLELFVGNAGTAARFLAALVCLGKGVYRLRGVPRMHERPQAPLFKALRKLGYEVDAWNEKLPVVIHGTGPRSGKCEISIKESSQFASALLLSGSKRGWQVEISGANQDEQPYVDMTRELLKSFPENGGVFQIEPDASSGSYFWGAGWLLRHSDLASGIKTKLGTEGSAPDITAVSVRHWPDSGLQVDADFLQLISGKLLLRERQHGDKPPPSYGVFLTLPSEVSREQHLGDSIMTAAVLAPFVGQVIRLTDLGRLRVQESERVIGLRTELTKCGVKVVEQADTLTILPATKKLHGAEIETYDDHRMAMCFAILGLKVPGIKIKNPSCVKKTFPDFFQKLAAAPPRGLGAAILNPKNGNILAGAELLPA